MQLLWGLGQQFLERSSTVTPFPPQFLQRLEPQLRIPSTGRRPFAWSRNEVPSDPLAQVNSSAEVDAAVLRHLEHLIRHH